MKTILIVDDHAILRKGLIQLLEGDFQDYIFLEASNGIEALSVLRKEKVDLALLDIAMPKMNGIELLKQLEIHNISTPSIILSMQEEDQYALRVFKAGASGFLSKNSAPEILIKAIRKVLSGRKYISENVADILADNVNKKDVKNILDHLSNREIQVLQLIANGLIVSEIAKEIGLSVNTISTYRSRILKKLSLKNNAAIIKFAIDHNLG
ncbi:MAG: response regulator transcription factor [Bacteroidia bacterium]|nr:response regulator transcription factor [Bacteroidia bacterium]NND25379.1 response regulator transcription factor [Flavobacteriaceae bacterium]MBT8279573.1 response regulator transcription factor [Bacteroidia bacterium]NNK60284.1 response regulator transcription factor [Flavobacteriaceae bacterium]NNL34092.1 response regulator transcription factor [Flavobacteriaceae bacterium]